MANFYHSVRLDESLCKGCINCIKRCPTQAIRVRNGKAVITSEFCIDCGECIRICQHHAKLPTYDSVDIMKNYKHTVALPAPALYGQFNNLTDVRVVLTALKIMGFDDVFEVSGAAELVSEISRDYVMKHTEHWPIISTACPVIVRLIRVRFPNLITHMLPVLPPVEVAARLARKKAMAETGLPAEDIGILFISPCPAKTTFAKAPLCTDKSEIDGVLAIKDIYPLLLGPMKQAALAPEDLSISGRIGIGWGSTGGEAGGLLSDSYLAADGMENVIRVLEDLEDEKFHDLQFIELNACSGGCVGGVLTVENPYIAQAKLKRLHKYEVVARDACGETFLEKPPGIRTGIQAGRKSAGKHQQNQSGGRAVRALPRSGLRFLRRPHLQSSGRGHCAWKSQRERLHPHPSGISKRDHQSVFHAGQRLKSGRIRSIGGIK